jgi:hypothetical protein
MKDLSSLSNFLCSATGRLNNQSVELQFDVVVAPLCFGDRGQKPEKGYQNIGGVVQQTLRGETCANGSQLLEREFPVLRNS